MKLENLSVEKFLRLITIGLLATSFLVLLCLFFGYEEPAGGFVRRVADRCVSGMGRDFPALLSKKIDPVHRQPMPDAG